MINTQALNYQLVVDRVSATNGATITSGQIDTLGYDQLTVLISSSTSNAATNKPATLRLTESDDTVLTNFAAITTLTGGTATNNFTIPNMQTATSTQPYAVLNVDCKARKRYITLEVSPVTTQTFVAYGILSRAEIAPTTTTLANVSGVIVNA